MFQISVETYRSWGTSRNGRLTAALVIQKDAKVALLLQCIDQAVARIVEPNRNNIASLRSGSLDVRDADFTNFLPI